jgi:hypothetical protein
MWAIFFFGNAVAIAWLAFTASPERWRSYTGGWIYTQMLAITCVEFFVRKTWFRYYYHGGAFDRVWSRWFPAENTAQGRASLEYIVRYREQQALARDAASNRGPCPR